MSTISGFLRSGSDYGSHLSALDPPEQQQREREADTDDGEAVGGIAEASRDRHREIEHRGYGYRIEIVAHQERARLFEQQDEGEGQQHLVEMLAGVEITEEAAPP